MGSKKKKHHRRSSERKMAKELAKILEKRLKRKLHHRSRSSSASSTSQSSRASYSPKRSKHDRSRSPSPLLNGKTLKEIIPFWHSIRFNLRVRISENSRCHNYHFYLIFWPLPKNSIAVLLHYYSIKYIWHYPITF